jgi:ferritin-like metal-binding protein YciE
MPGETLQDVYVEQLKDLYSAEQQILKALPKMAKAVTHADLRKAFQEHEVVTRTHVERLDSIFAQLGEKGTGHKCKGMEGLLAEGDELLEEHEQSEALDAALIAAAQRVEHYEIAGYGTAKTLADQLGHGDAKDLLDQTLDEESQADTLLTKIATGGRMRSGVNEAAKR